MEDIPIEGGVEQIENQEETGVESAAPDAGEADLLDGSLGDELAEQQPKRKKLRKRAKLSDESGGEQDDEIAPLDEDNDENQAGKGAGDEKSDDDEAGGERAELPDEEDGDNERPRKRKRSDSGSAASGDADDDAGGAGDSDNDGEFGGRKNKRRKKLSKRKKGKMGGAEDGGDDMPKSKKAAQKQQKEEAEMIAQTKLKEDALRFVSQMNEACDADISANKENRPALSKIKLLPKVIEMLASLTLQNALMDCGILHAVRKWLEPLPDKTLPNIRIREALLRGLDYLPVTESHLTESRIGRIVMFLLKNDSESAANKTLAKKLIDKWSRPVFELSSNWMDLQYHDEVRSVRKLAQPRQANQQQDDDVLGGPQRVEPVNKKRKVTDFLARMPEKSTMEFTVRPMSAIDPDQKGARALSATEMLERKLKKGQASAGGGRHATVGITKANRK